MAVLSARDNLNVVCTSCCCSTGRAQPQHGDIERRHCMVKHKKNGTTSKTQQKLDSFLKAPSVSGTSDSTSTRTARAETSPPVSEPEVLLEPNSSPPTMGCASANNSWVADRLIGLDATGERCALEQWGTRCVSRMTCTDMSLRNKQHAMAAARPVSGWRKLGDGKKVFVARTVGGTRVAEGAEAFRLAMAYGKAGGAGSKKGGSDGTPSKPSKKADGVKKRGRRS